MKRGDERGIFLELEGVKKSERGVWSSCLLWKRREERKVGFNVKQKKSPSQIGKVAHILTCVPCCTRQICHVWWVVGKVSK